MHALGRILDAVRDGDFCRFGDRNRVGEQDSQFLVVVGVLEFVIAGTDIENAHADSIEFKR
jgi:hypothetical protein